VYPFDFPDPDVLFVGGTYYAYGTNSAGGNIQIISSTDLVNWHLVGDALPREPSWAVPGATWAPAVIDLGGNFLMYYTTTTLFGSQCISVASSGGPQGPFLDESSGPLVCQTSDGGSIDPSPYQDGAGNLYLTWKSIGGSLPATIWSQPLSSNGDAMSGSPAVLLQPTESWEGGIVEAPTMVLVDGQYYLFFSGSNWDSSQYAIGVARCQGPTGPCSEALGQPLLTSEAGFSGPGGPAIFTDSGGSLWMAFAAWLPGSVGYPNARLLFLRRLTFASGVPQIGSSS